MVRYHKIFIPNDHLFCVVTNRYNNSAPFQFLSFALGISGIYYMGDYGNCAVYVAIVPGQQKEDPLNWQEMICGIITVLLFCGALSVVLYYQCVTTGVLDADKLFLEESLNAICCFFLLPVILFFTLVFSISALILGALREKFSGFLKNLLLLAVTPVGFLLFTGITAWQLRELHFGRSDSIFSIFAAAVGWVIFMFLPYGFMLWRGKKEQDKTKICNGVAGIWAVNFFMLGLFLLGYICRGR